MKFVGITRGGVDGVIAIFEADGHIKYFEKLAIISLLKQASGDYAVELHSAIHALDRVESYDDVPEFESGIPSQPSLFN